MTVFQAKSSGVGLDLGSDYNRARFKDWLKKNEGVPLRIETSLNPVSDNMRGYVFNALIPFMRGLDYGWNSIETDEDIYEVLKLQFNFKEITNPVTGERQRVGQSTLNKSCRNKLAMEFIMRIANYVMDNYGQSLPDPEEYKGKKEDESLEVNPKYL